ncbi:short chain fatty acids transporter [Aeropyrum pernix]|uniref:Short chain fatty acids transporter n=1 Tax=Aeropyrum pernix TaxID=56636 RepID=A0A401H9G9_AERPX|nr:short-chain fatty acid transporter [Aeropyrum pernix]GBF09008.1 short chain fatty acids transporter [Aeropyrum pernix]
MGDESRRPFLEAFGEALERSVRGVMPDPFIFAILLTFIAIVLDLILLRPIQHAGLGGTVEFLVYSAWYGGFWKLLTFSMQMTLILVTGYVIAYHPLVYRVLSRIAGLPRDTKQAAVLAAAVAIALSYLSWGLSLIGGAILAREIGRQAAFRGRKIHYPVVVAAAYSGLGLTWHWGLTASAPLLMNTPGHFLADVVKELYGVETIPLSQTIFHPYTIINFLLITLAALAIYWLISPSRGPVRGIEEFDPDALKEEVVPAGEKPRIETLADRLENSRTLAILTVILGFTAVAIELYTRGISRALNLNTMNFIFLMTGLLLYANPMSYARAFYRSVSSAAGVILQFHFYAGIFGLLNTPFEPLGKSSAQIIAEGLADVSTPFIWPVVAFLTAGIVNLFIPSGGGEWAAIGEILVRAGHELGVPIGKTIIAYGFGDSWTNLLQPFWAIPLLDITRTRARDVFGYTIALMILIAPMAAVTLTLIPY